jgi:hypothetical protein
MESFLQVAGRMAEESLLGVGDAAWLPFFCKSSGSAVLRLVW